MIMNKKSQEMLKRLGTQIKEQRAVRQLNQFDLSIAAGISKGYMCQIENGVRVAALPVLNDIADALEISLSTMFAGV